MIKQMNGRISQTQIISIGVCNLMGTIIISAYISSVLGNEAWLAGILGFAANLPALFIYCTLAKKYPGKSLLQIFNTVFGVSAGRVISAVYLMFFFALCARSLMEATNFLSFFILPDTMPVLIAALLVAGCIYSVKKGIIPLARVSTVFLIVMSAALLIYVTISLVNARFEYLLPMFSHKPPAYAHATFLAAAYPYGETVLLLMLVPALDKKVSIRKTYFAVTGAAALIMALVHVYEITALGSVAEYSALPTYEAARLVHLPGILTRIESLFALALIMLSLYKTIVVFHVITDGLNQLTSINKRRFAIVPGLLLVACGVTVFASPARNFFIGLYIAPFVWLGFTLALPFITLIAAAVRAAAGAE